MNLVIFTYLLLLALICIVTDFRWRRIPNIVTFPSILLAFGYHFATAGAEGFAFSLSGVVVGLSLLLIPHMIGVIGAGDIKMLGAFGAIVGPQGVIVVFLYAAIAGGLYAIWFLIITPSYHNDFIAKHYLVLKKFVLTREFTLGELSIAHNGPTLGYGIAIAIGAFVYISEAFFGFTLLSNNLFA